MPKRILIGQKDHDAERLHEVASRLGLPVAKLV